MGVMQCDRNGCKHTCVTALFLMETTKNTFVMIVGRSLMR